jgi:HEAT repeat protein
MGEPAREAVPGLRALLEDRQAAVRVQAAAALWKLDNQVETTVPVLAGVLRGDGADVETKLETLVLLGEMGPQAAAAVGTVQVCFGDKHEAVRRTAAQTLGKIGRPAQVAIPVLEEVARQDPEPEVRQAATAALEAIRAASK